MNRISITIALCASLVLAPSCSKNKNDGHMVKEGPFKAGITETGELKAINSIMVPMPFVGWKYGWQYKIIYLAEHGQKVNVGDTIVKIDPSPIIKVLEEEKNKLESEKANLNKLLANNKSSLSQIRSEMESEKANRNLIVLQLEKFSFEPERKKQQKALELKIADIKVANLSNKLKNQTIVFENDIRIQNIKLQQIEKSITEAESALDKLKITSPIKGIVQLEWNRRTKAMVQVGDDIYQGFNIASIPDMSHMKVVSQINESDIGKLINGQKVIVRLDAYPEKKFNGKVSYIGKLCRNKENDSKIKVFDFEVMIEGNSEALKPGMTVGCELILTKLDNALYVENDCVFKDKAGGYYVISEKENKKIPVKILAVSNNYSAISGSIKQGAKLLSGNIVNSEFALNK